MNSLCYIISLFSYILQVRFGNRVWRKRREKKTVQTSQIIEGWANHDPLSRTRLYFIYFQTCFCLFGTGFAFDFNQRLCFLFSGFAMRNWQDQMFEIYKISNVNVDKVELKYKAVWRENVARDSKLKGKTWCLDSLKTFYGMIIFVLKIVFTRAQGSRATCHLTDFDKTLPV